MKVSGIRSTLGLLWWVKERQREGERARVTERGGFASLFSPSWTDQLGRHWCDAVMWHAQPSAVSLDGQPIQIGCADLVD